VDLYRAELPPIALDHEVATWKRSRRLYEMISRASQLPLVGGAFKAGLDTITSIPRFHPNRDLTRADLGVRSLERLIGRGIGEGLVSRLKQTQEQLLTTFYAMALAADHHGYDRVWCVVTDTDCARVWAPRQAQHTRIRYLAPSQRVRRRLEAYGVPAGQIHLTGFPLPPSLLGGRQLPTLRENLARRLHRLDPKGRFVAGYERELRHFLPEWTGAIVEDSRPMLTFAVGGAGAQTELVHKFLPSLAPLLSGNRLKLCLIAGIRPEAAELFERALTDLKVDFCLFGHGDAPVEIVIDDTFEGYAAQFNQAMARTDILWTKPSELVFFGALGLPLQLTRPIGVQEYYNRRWATEHGVAMVRRPSRFVADWLVELLNDGAYARAAWSGFMRLPKFGTYEIADLLSQP